MWLDLNKEKNGNCCDNESSQTYCQEKSSYHDSDYLWYKLCNKILCKKCSWKHLLENQLDHSSINKNFFQKEHLYVEYKSEIKRLDELREIFLLFEERCKSQIDLYSLHEAFFEFSELARIVTKALEDL